MFVIAMFIKVEIWKILKLGKNIYKAFGSHLILYFIVNIYNSYISIYIYTQYIYKSYNIVEKCLW